MPVMLSLSKVLFSFVLLDCSIRIAEQRSKELYAKLGYRDQYKTPEERDKVENYERSFFDHCVYQHENLCQ